MKRFKKMAIAVLILTSLFSFRFANEKVVEFSFPKRNNTTITLNATNFEGFTEEWRGTDYYYLGTSKDSIICSVYYFKLNKEEQKYMVEPFGGVAMAGIPMIYFSDNSPLKKYEVNKSGWGNITDDFMFRQCDILEYEGIKMRQKNMYAYGMFDNDLFVSVHLSKENYTLRDSTAMRQLLHSIKKKK
ncbi:hypothetical protein SGQ44_07120 [Flavobacterium sp. Fl-77]|uniref:Uncharacterized protein n=1 Tax=Flavobacterium flavipigmentatum TaxID=2893884 RepID=A0AAJ2S6N9_9FLAO|nr:MULTISPECIES: hypothetical protein [unclassified Flavobacterium]MDX6181443.1 hypothetical protein [Flavobacterium sp. Fl-33]MDX6185523.1 hypothetical protein [Flavobacterium sp. Fl-77]UFH37626.1 hypothetical protein LNP22_12850 [Flavobacterium sp. F-70]